jgi:signal peptidase I
MRARLFTSYVGSSMHPTLLESDLMEVLPYEAVPVRVGDVVSFVSPSNREGVVHRVVEVTKTGVRTRGDNLMFDDIDLLDPSDIRGRVVAIIGKTKRKKIQGGWRGSLVGFRCRLRRTALQAARRCLRQPYHALAGNGFLQVVLPRRTRRRVLSFRSPQGRVHKLVLGDRLVGQYDGQRDRWCIRPPFRLFVDERNLPRAPW